jgi:hypothetical protein
MAILPATGSAIVMGNVYRQYYNATATGGTNVALRSTLGSRISITSGAISFSSNFGGRTTPYN